MSAISDHETSELTMKVDLSDLMAEIDTLCFLLDFYEMGKWWDYKHSRRKLSHPAVAAWLERYGFDSFHTLPIGAVVAMRDSLQRYLAAHERGESVAALPPQEEPA